ncbi:5041_t:CDS:2 [Paraglomus occultum]|uniref:5041_t:CDS:1 n=1 Tax=Paraglomus occultum TaxID=144539 RepID=A0A9N9CT30_9GLOM|nr:5041_t:CDS:2 [Paraglomus occultum]
MPKLRIKFTQRPNGPLPTSSNSPITRNQGTKRIQSLESINAAQQSISAAQASNSPEEMKSLIEAASASLAAMTTDNITAPSPIPPSNSTAPLSNSIPSSVMEIQLSLFPAISFNYPTRDFSLPESILPKDVEESKRKASRRPARQRKASAKAREAAEPYLLKRGNRNNRGEFLHRRGKGRSRGRHNDGFGRRMISSSGSNQTRASSGRSGRGRGFSVSAGQKSGLRRNRRKNAGQKKQTDYIPLHLRKGTSKPIVPTQEQIKKFPLVQQSTLADYDYAPSDMIETPLLRAVSSSRPVVRPAKLKISDIINGFVQRVREDQDMKFCRETALSALLAAASEAYAEVVH